MSSTDLSPTERLKRVSELLKTADRYVLAGEFQKATEQVEQVFLLDKDNIYAQAYLNRIEVFRQRDTGSGEQKEVSTAPEREQVTESHTPKDVPPEETDANKPEEEKIQKEASPLLKSSETRQKLSLEAQRRFVEDIISKEAETLKGGGSPGNSEVQAVPVPKQTESTTSEREENEQKYKRALGALWKSGSIGDTERRGLEKLRIALDIPEERHQELERSVKLLSYVNAVKEAWQDGLITPTGAVALEELRDRYEISINEHLMIEARIMFEIHGLKIKGNIMIIDDDVELVKIIKSILREEGYAPFSASSPEGALAILDRTVPDLILLDITFPKPSISGFTMYERIREIQQLRFVPVIFMSGLDEEHIIQVGKKLGADDYITKPCSEEMLVSSIEGKIKRYREMRKILDQAGGMIH